jgi:hypothetical protein
MYTKDGRITCMVEHRQHGWIPITIDADGYPDLFAEIEAAGDVAAYVAPAPDDHATQRAAAYAKIDVAHAGFIGALAGDATSEERDTWPEKASAARAMVAGTAEASQSAMIVAEAAGDGTGPAALAAVIVAKADAMRDLIGAASGLRRKARAAVAAASDESVDIDAVADAIAAVLSVMNDEAKAAALEWAA